MRGGPGECTKTRLTGNFRKWGGPCYCLPLVPPNLMTMKKSTAAATPEAPATPKVTVFATGKVAAVPAQPFTRPPAFVPKKPRGS